MSRCAASASTPDLDSAGTAAETGALLVSGETGSGKGLSTRILHHSGPRASEPLIEVNCAALPHELLEPELFGHEAGAFTGARARRRGLVEQADGGTVFLDEISEMPVDLQAKLLGAIEDRTERRIGGERAIAVDVQIVAASNRDHDRCVRERRFRSDLFHRLSAFQLRLPPLRERLDELAELVPAFVAEFNSVAGKRVTKIGDDVWTALRGHDWPGNIRELRNVVERCVLFAESERFPTRWLQLSGPHDRVRLDAPGEAIAANSAQRVTAGALLGAVGAGAVAMVFTAPLAPALVATTAGALLGSGVAAAASVALSEADFRDLALEVLNEDCWLVVTDNEHEAGALEAQSVIAGSLALRSIDQSGAVREETAIAD